EPPPPPAPRAEVEPKLNAYHDAANHYTFLIPTGWRAMSEKELDRLHQFVAGRMGGMDLHYEGGLRRVSGPAWSYPYVLLQVQPMPAHGLSFDELERDLKNVLPVALEKATGELGDLARNASVGSAVLDRDRKIVVLRMKMDVAGVGTVQGLSVMHLGSDAMVSLHCYAQDGDFEHYLRLFTDMNNSFQFDDGYDFKPAPARSNRLAPAVGIAVGAVVLVVFGGSLCLLLALVRQARRVPPREDDRRPTGPARDRPAGPPEDEEIPWVLPADPDPAITDKPRDRPAPPPRPLEDAP
ncbi:MAG TPA: hypothetical protein VJ739_14715, partial [Gemmataceae bacterium]|nr:hypothetical protein [Gemmataceae bacterium]